LPLPWENRLFDDLVTLLRVSFSYIDVQTQQRAQMCFATCCPHSKPNPFGGSPAACRPAPTQNLTRAWWPPNDSHRKHPFHVLEHVHPVSIPTCSLRSPSSFTFPTEFLCRQDLEFLSRYNPLEMCPPSIRCHFASTADVTCLLLRRCHSCDTFLKIHKWMQSDPSSKSINGRVVLPR